MIVASLLLMSCIATRKMAKQTPLPRFMTLEIFEPPELKGFWLVEPREMREGKYQFGIMRRLEIKKTKGGGPI